MAEVSREEIKHIANLACLNLNDDEIDNYIKNLEDILNYANVVNSVDVSELDITIGANEKCNAFRKDEIVNFDNTEGLLQNAPTKERNMFKIPKVIKG